MNYTERPASAKMCQWNYCAVATQQYEPLDPTAHAQRFELMLKDRASALDFRIGGIAALIVDDIFL